MKVGVISTVGVPACYGGYETLVENLLTYRQDVSAKYQIYCSSPAYAVQQKQYKQATLKYLPFKANGPMAIVYDSVSLFHAYLTCDIIMSLGTVGCFWLPFLKLFSKKKVIVNLDGLDDKREKWGKIARFVIGNARNIAARRADVIIADNQVIQEYIKNTYNRNSVLIEYGGDNAQPYYNEQELASYGLSRYGYVFKVARIEPENKIDVILKAFSEMPNRTLVLVGNWDKNEYGRKTREFYSQYKNLMLLDPIYDPKKINLLRSNCSLYIHGHSAGGTNPSLVEAMFLGLPIIASDVSYNRSTTEGKALYFKDANDLRSLVLNLSEDVKKRIALDMKEIATRRYMWSIIAKKYEELYN